MRRPFQHKRQASSKKVVNGVINGQPEGFDEIEDGGVPNGTEREEPPKDLVSLTKADKQNFERKLNSIQTTEKKPEFIPVWTLEDADGQPKEKFSESTETQGRYRKYAEQGLTTILKCLMKVLWPLLHYVLWSETDGRQEITWWKDYVKLNQKFAQKIIEIYQPGDLSTT